MARYLMNDGKIVDSEKAGDTWNEATRWNGSHYISINTGSHREHETLYRSAKGRYWKLYDSAYRQGQTGEANYVAPFLAATWMLANGHPLPEDLRQFEDDILE